MLDIRIVRYDRAAHDAWTFCELRTSLAKGAFGSLYTARSAIIRNPRGCVVAVDPDDENLLLGVLLSPGPQQVAWAYTKYVVRRLRIASRLAESVGIDLALPTAVGVWTRAASRIVSKGYRLVPAVTAEGMN